MPQWSCSAATFDPLLRLSSVLSATHGPSEQEPLFNNREKPVSEFECGRLFVRIHDGITAQRPNIEKPLPLNPGLVIVRVSRSHLCVSILA